MKNDLISRQDAIDALCAVCGNDCDKSEFVYNAPQDEQVILCPEHYCLCTLPSVQPRKGKWMNRRLLYMDVHMATCDQCEKRVVVGDFCPNCGSYNGGDSDE